MAVKIRCKECSKKLQVDEAFAGGVCRCPYCKALIFVHPPKTAGTAGSRPDSPGGRPATPGRPDTPYAGSGLGTGLNSSGLTSSGLMRAREQHALSHASTMEDIPVANPVRIQGVISMVLIGLSLIMLVAGAIILVKQMTAPSGPVDPDAGIVSTNGSGLTGFTVNTEFPAIAGDVRIEAPVVYCLDTSGNMGDVLAYASRMVLVSVNSLREGKFNVVLVGEEGDNVLSETMLSSDGTALGMATAFLKKGKVAGAADLERGLDAAMKLSPKTVVLLARESDMGLEDAAAKLKAKGMHLTVLAIESDEYSQKEFAQAAESTGGVCRTIAQSDLNRWAAELAQSGE